MIVIVNTQIPEKETVDYAKKLVSEDGGALYWNDAVAQFIDGEINITNGKIVAVDHIKYLYATTSKVLGYLMMQVRHHNVDLWILVPSIVMPSKQMV